MPKKNNPQKTATSNGVKFNEKIKSNFSFFKKQRMLDFLKPSVRKKSYWIKVFLIVIFLSLCLWIVMDIFQKDLKLFFLAQIQDKQEKIVYIERPINPKFLPLRNWRIPDFETQARAVISVKISPQEEPKILFQKNRDKELPIASIVKLMTGLVVLKNYEPELIIEISEQAANQIGETGKLRAGEKFYIFDLLYPLLIESSNGAAYALSEVIGQEYFVELMNLKAEELGMKNTLFVNPSGLDNKPLYSDVSYSTVSDLIYLTQEILTHPKLMRIMSLSEYKFYSSEGVLQYLLINTNQLLNEIPEIIGGKTGFTEKAGQCLLVILNSPRKDSYIVSIVLGSPNRFKETRELIEWKNNAFVWK
ncbi:MAG: serine hydrolase [Candidatus Pacebacteria bacterium]|nr:serine hydrolase [Candidatus Paceibacterota bacterium]